MVVRRSQARSTVAPRRARGASSTRVRRPKNGGTRRAAGSKFPRRTPNVNAPPPPVSGEARLQGKSRQAFGIGPEAGAKMDRLLDTARQFRSGNKPQGVCYRFVKHYLKQAGSGAMVDELVDQKKGGRARDFADYFNKHPDRLAAHGYRKLPAGTNPFDAPKGAIVVVAPRSPGTRHKTAGDITVATGQGTFVNDGVMRYGGDRSFFDRKPGQVLGIYVPAN